MNIIDKKVIGLISSNKKIIENYFFMTILQVINSFFYLLIYPYLIRTLGPQNYGLFIFVNSIISFFIYFVNYGFELPAMKLLAQHPKNKLIRIKVLSEVFVARFFLEIFSIIILIVLFYTIPFFKQNFLLISICFVQTLSYILFPRWYFEALQQMKTVTIIQIIFKFITLPFIFFLIKQSKDLNTFALINSLGIFLGALTATFMIFYNEKSFFIRVKLRNIMKWYKDSFAFFISQAMNVLKEQIITIIIGSFFNMTEVAYYDLANKIISVPRTLVMSINGALFPKMVNEYKNIKLVRKIIKYEFLIGLLLMLCVILFGKIAINLLGGAQMLESYDLSVILSVTILSWLVVSAYVNFIFIPNNKFYFVSINQFSALITFILFSIIGFLFWKNIYVLVFALAGSAIFEILNCIYLTHKNKLL